MKKTRYTSVIFSLTLISSVSVYALPEISRETKSTVKELLEIKGVKEVEADGTKDQIKVVQEAYEGRGHTWCYVGF